jgi:hypothetical protein
MAWKLKKSKVEDNGDSADAIPSVVVTHGHVSASPAQNIESQDDFFRTQSDDLELSHEPTLGNNTDFDTTDFMSEHPLPQHDELPVIQSEFVDHDHTIDNSNHVVHADIEEPRAERAPIDFGDVDFDADQDHETLDFGTHPEPEPTHLSSDHIDFGENHVTDPNQTIMSGESFDPVAQMHTPSASVSEDIDKTVMPSSLTAESNGASHEIHDVVASPVVSSASPVAQTPTKVLVKLGPFTAEHELTGEQTNLQIGRPDYNTGEAPAISIELDDAISRKHARIIIQDGQCKIEDLGSTNGTLINGQRLMANVPMPFNIGDVVRVGERTEISLKA